MGRPAWRFDDHDHVVVDIGDVLDVADFISEGTQVAAKCIELDVGERVTEMSDVVGGDAADVAYGRCRE